MPEHSNFAGLRAEHGFQGLWAYRLCKAPLHGHVGR